MPSQYLINRTVPPSVEPVTRDELKEHARVLNTDTGQDQSLDDAIAGARDQFELRSDVAIMSQTWQLSYAGAYNMVRIPKPPIVDVTEVSYVDADLAAQVLDPADYRLFNGGMSPSWLEFSGTLPVVGSVMFPWSITFTCGVADPTLLWPGIRNAVLVLAAQLYEYRVESQDKKLEMIPHGFESIVAQYRTYWSFP